jgi:hypothetical protein
MARTIGSKNKSIIKQTIIKKMKVSPIDYEFPSDEEVIEDLPEEMWNTWEGADSEIRNLIRDYIMEIDVSKVRKLRGLM